MSKEITPAGTAQAQEDLRAAIAALKKASAEEDAAARASQPELRGISETIVAQISTLVEEGETLFKPWAHPLLPIERTRLNGVAIKNLGFVETAYNSAIVNPDLIPNYLNRNTWHNDFNDYLRKQQLLSVVQRFENLISDSLLAAGDVIYEESRAYYNALREAAKLNAYGAEEEYAKLKPYFTHSKTSGTQPTEAELERDFHSLLHRTKEGKLVIENKAPEAAQGKLTVTDEVESRKNIGLSETYVEKKD